MDGLIIYNIPWGVEFYIFPLSQCQFGNTCGIVIMYFKNCEEIKHSRSIKNRSLHFIFFLASEFPCPWTSTMEKSVCQQRVPSQTGRA